ncbi:MAG: peptidoglycan recognition protein family protein [Pseudonocardia sp.]
MAWYPGATKMELQPESDDQAAIRPTQLIVHSMAAPWTPRRLYEFWRDSTNLEAHFGLGYGGDLAQYIGTETRADANAAANGRAISVETASNTSSTDPWTAEQVDKLIDLGVWAHRRHDIPLRICRTATDPGFGWHRLHSAWSTGGTACPGRKRIEQFKEVVMPGIRARAAGEDDMPITDADAKKVARAVAELDAYAVPWTSDNKKNQLNNAVASMWRIVYRTEAEVKAQRKVIDKLADALGQAGSFDPEVLKREIRAAIESITVHLDAGA